MHQKYLADVEELYDKEVGISLRSIERPAGRRSMKDGKIKLQEL